MIRIIKYLWYRLVMVLTNWMGDMTPVLRLRGFLAGPAFRKCGKNLQVASGAIINWSSNVSIGDDVFIANYCWLQGFGGIELNDEVMLGPYTVLASNDHTKEGGSYRFGRGRAAKIVMERGAWTGAHTVITAGVTIGSGSAVAAGAVVTRDVLSNTTVGGVPARQIAHFAPRDE